MNEQTMNSSACFANLKQVQDAEVEAALECAKSARETSNSQMQVLTSKRAITNTSPTVCASADRFMLPGFIQTEPDLEI